MELETDILSLTKQLTRPILLYWPNALLDHLDKEQKEAILETNIFDKMILLDVNSDYVEFEEHIEQIELLKKEKTLKMNVVRLIELSETQSKASFQFQLEDYMDDVESWVAASKYICDEAKNETSNYFDALQPYLDLQHQYFKDHLEQVKKRFHNLIKQSKNNDDLVVVPKINSDGLSSIIQKLDLNSEIPNSNFTQQDTTAKRKKKAKLKEAEVDDYLLNSVFNIDKSLL